jgi:hypothetical protein
MDRAQIHEKANEIKDELIKLKDEGVRIFNERTSSLNLSKKEIFIYSGALIFSLLIMFKPVFRWNILLAIYMPFNSGLYLDIELFEPLWRAYYQFEYNAFPSLFEPSFIPEILAEDYTWDHFLEVSHTMTRAVVIRGLFNGSEALKTYGTKEWVANHNDFDLQEIKHKGGFKSDYTLSSADFVEYMQDIRDGNYRYSYGLDELYTRYPELIPDLEHERYGKHDGRDYNFCRSIALFTSSAGPGIKWHNADSPNLGMMIKGRKTFHLIDAKYSFFLGPEGKVDPYATGFSARSPEYIVKQVPEMNVTISPGDVIFVPTWWWHSVDSHNVEGDPSKLCMMNTCRFSEIRSAVTIGPVLEVFRHTGFINWMHPKVPLIFRWVPYFRVLQDGFRQYFNLYPHWDDEDCFSSKKKACEKYFESVGVTIKSTTY